MFERIKKILVLIEGILLIPGLVFILLSNIFEIVENGSEGVSFFSAILLIVMVGLSLIMALGTFSFYKKNNAEFLQPGYDYIFNSIVVALTPTGIVYAIKSSDAYFQTNNIDVSFIYALIVLSSVYLSAYAFVSRRKTLSQLHFIPFLILLADFGIYLYIVRQMWSIIGFSIVAVCILIASAISFLSPYKEPANATTADSNAKVASDADTASNDTDSSVSNDSNNSNNDITSS